jgi:hypothetical protein
MGKEPGSPNMAAALIHFRASSLNIEHNQTNYLFSYIYSKYNGQ